MNSYETVVIVSNKITNEQRNNVVEKIKRLISENGNITNFEELGEKKLSYKIREHEKAFYYLINFESKPSFVQELARNYRIIEEIIKYITVRKERNDK